MAPLQAAFKEIKFPKYGLQPASGNHIPSEGGTPGLPPLVTPEHRVTPLGPPSPYPGDHRKCQQSESQENSPLAQSEGAGCRQRGLPLGGPLTSQEEDSPGKAGRWASARPHRQGWALRETGELCGGQGPVGEGEGKAERVLQGPRS